MPRKRSKRFKGFSVPNIRVQEGVHRPDSFLYIWEFPEKTMEQITPFLGILQGDFSLLLRHGAIFLGPNGHFCLGAITAKALPESFLVSIESSASGGFSKKEDEAYREVFARAISILWQLYENTD